MDMANKYGKMGVSTMANGKGIRLMDKELLYMQMEIFMRGNG